MSSWLVLCVAGGYVSVLFVVAWWGETKETHLLDRLRSTGFVYVFSIAIYNTAWSFYGSVGRAATSGFDFLPIYIGPLLLFVYARPIFVRIVAIAKEQNSTSISDFISARYGRSRLIASLVTIISIAVLMPYISLQLKAIGVSYELLTREPTALGDQSQPLWADSTFGVAVAMAIFSIIFGVRHIQASEHHAGFMLAVAFESLVKILSFACVAGAIAWTFFHNPAGDIVASARDEAFARFLDFQPFKTSWLTGILTAMAAFFCLPHMFHVLIVENETPAHIKRAAWIYPLYLCVLSLFIIPVAVAGWAVFRTSVNPDTYMIILPIAVNQPWLALAAFIGGLSAATGMVIMASVSLATMICNDLVLPALLPLRTRFGQNGMTRLVLTIRRAAICVILSLAYVLQRGLDPTYPLTDIGLISFVGVAQLAPALFGGLLWRRANHAGAALGLGVGFIIWVYTLLFPTLAPALGATVEFIEHGFPAAPWVAPHALFGLTGMDPITHATFWSLLFNATLLVVASRLRRPSLLESLQSVRYAPLSRNDRRAGQLQFKGHIDDLVILTSRYVGSQAAIDAFENFYAGRDTFAQRVVDLESVRFAEYLIAGAIGAVSARVVIAAALEHSSLTRNEVVGILDEASNAIQFGQTLLRNVLESVPQGICAFDENWHVTAWNRRYIERLRLPHNMLRAGATLTDIIQFNQTRNEYGANDLKQLVINRDLEQQTWPYVYTRHRPDGTVLEISFDRSADGGYVSTLTDVSEQHKAAAALQEANDLLESRVIERTHALEQAKADAERANTSKSLFLAALSHDLLQPLNAARLFTSALEHGASESGDPRQGDLLLGLKSSLRSTDEMIEALQDISLLDTGNMQAHPGPFAINDLLEELRIEFAALAAQKGVSLHVMHSTHHINSDRGLLGRLLRNIISNAVRYTPTGKILVGCRNHGSSVRICVLDTGIGIAPEYQTEIFEEFKSLASGLDHTQERRLGLGLAIVIRIANLLDHNINVRSTPGRGTQMSVDVQRAVSSSALPSNPAILDQHEPKRLRILCLDDDRLTREGLETLLTRWGHDVWSCASPAEALAHIDRPPDAAIVDYHLGSSINGCEVIHILVQHWGTSIPIVLCTSDRSAAVADYARKENWHFLSKPLKAAQLRKFLMSVNQQSSSNSGSDS